MNKTYIIILLIHCLFPAMGQDANELWNELKRDDHNRIIQNGKILMTTKVMTYYWRGQDTPPRQEEKLQDGN